MIPSDDNQLYNIVVDTIIGLGILVNVYLIVDQTTDGALSRSVSIKFAKFRASVQKWADKEATFRKQKPHVLFDAMTIVEGENAG